jgi:carbon-monoxide dehydrogenase iron sulfur subunit
MIKVDLSRCTGCGRCAVHCSFFHTGKINPRLSRIKVLNLYESGVDGPVVCVQCRERYCLKCPEKALSVGPQGQIYVSPTRCTLCGACELNCPIGALEIFEGIVFVCDLCGGRPRCVEACTEGAVTWEKDETEALSLVEFRKDAGKKSPALKRFAYLRSLGEELRKFWSARNV